MKNKLVNLTNVNMVYTNPQGEQFNALKDINLEIGEGEYIAILGTSGSGKTTLSNVIGMLNNSYRGEYIFDEIAVHKLKENKLVQVRGEKFGFIFQDYVLLDFLNAVENVALALQYHNIPKNEIYARAKACLVSVGLGDKLYHKPFQLSGGQKQRVSIARALIKNPKVIIADEPTGALDHNSRVEVLSLLQELNEQGVTIITVTHSEEDAQAAKRIIQVEKGSITSDRLQRNRARFFGRLVNFENSKEVALRKKLVLDYVNLNFGVSEVNDFLSIGTVDSSPENKYKLLLQFKSEWLAVQNVSSRLLAWYSHSEELIKMLIAVEVLKAKSKGISALEFEPIVKTFFMQVWSEETAMSFFSHFRKIDVSVLKNCIQLNHFFKHGSNKVRATAIQFFKIPAFISASEQQKYLDIILMDSDHRVRSNMLDYLYTVKDFDFQILKKFGFERDSSARVRAIWAEMLISLGERNKAMQILEPLIFSEHSSEILAGVWVLAKDKDFHITSFLAEKLDSHPKLLMHIDEILKTYYRVKRDLMGWRQDQAEGSDLEDQAEAPIKKAS